ncbi:MAG: DUF362 domain-containing protein [Spirochaetaceae bacterium]|nr:DUF362 domain-containing protein [Spirochaetaceae bacterium]
MAIFDELLKDIEIPRFVKVQYKMADEHIQDIPASVFGALDAREIREKIQPGFLVCIAVGSREIGHFPVIVKAVVDYVKSCGANPFIIPAMGSHGGATAQGQAQIINDYGITEEAMGAPIRAAMETVEIGQTESGLSVHIDRYADEADYIIPIGRIKPHTDFHGRVESGLCKMLTIGLGKQHGAYICHKFGFENMAKNVWDISGVVVEKKKNITALGILENAYHETFQIVAVPGERIHAEEPALLEKAKDLVAKLPFEKADILFVDEFGKNISGAGMDPNVTGRSACLPKTEPFFKSIAVRDLTEKTHGNCGGIGNADVTTQRVFEKFSFEASYPNAITAAEASGTKIPVVMPNDKLAFKFAIRTAVPFDEKAGIRIVWIKNTLALSEFYISEDLIQTANKIPALTIIDKEPRGIAFDKQGNVSGWL